MTKLPVIRMESTPLLSGLYQPSPRITVLLAGLVVFFVYFLTVSHFDSVLDGQFEDFTAFGAGVFFVGGLFLGRILSQLSSAQKTKISNTHLIWLFIANLILVILTVITTFLPSFLNLVFFLPPFIILSVTLGFFIKHIRTALTLQFQAVQITAEQSQHELQLLQSQLSPHFLFNTLNNLYGLSIAEPGKVPPLILQLSDLLRYSIYEAREIWVPLQEEWAYIRNYIEFERIRLGERLQLKVSAEDISDTVQIAPMLLIVFVENAFKHSKNTTEPQIGIEIELKLWGDSILFSIRNSYDATQKLPNELNKNSGLGLENVKKRLELLYAGSYDLKILAEANWYEVRLQLTKK